MKKLVLAAFAGAVVAYVISTVSWMILPWHSWDMKTFKNNGQVVSDGLKAEAMDPGIYMIPNMSMDMHTSEEAQKAWQDKATKGPWAFLVVKPQGKACGMVFSMLLQFFLQMLTAFGAGWILKKSTVKTKLNQALFVSLVVTMGSALVILQNWNWWGFPTTTTIVGVTDTFLSWFASGFVMAKILK